MEEAEVILAPFLDPQLPRETRQQRLGALAPLRRPQRRRGDPPERFRPERCCCPSDLAGIPRPDGLSAGGGRGCREDQTGREGPPLRDRHRTHRRTAPPPLPDQERVLRRHPQPRPPEEGEEAEQLREVLAFLSA